MPPVQPVRAVGAAVRDLRRALGWTQNSLAERAGLSQSLVSAVELGHVSDLTFATATRLLEAMGARLTVGVNPPFLGDRERQRDPVHATCSTHVARRLAAAGWEVATEVEVGGDRSRGWIDVIAFHPATRLLLIIEIKTEIHDFGAIERTLGWYEREAWSSVRRIGWKPQIVLAGLLVLATEANDRRLSEIGESVRRALPARARDLAPAIESGASTRGGRFVAMIDPGSRRRDWLRPLWIDGRRTRAQYVDYASFLRSRHSRRTGHGGRNATQRG